jgi:hypothetical protein
MLAGGNGKQIFGDAWWLEPEQPPPPASTLLAQQTVSLEGPTSTIHVPDPGARHSSLTGKASHKCSWGEFLSCTSFDL